MPQGVHPARTPARVIAILAIHAERVRSSPMIIALPVRLFTVVSNGVATPKPYYVGSSSSNRVNGRVSLIDVPLAGGMKGELSFR